jgi:hypothetical protein
MKKIYTLIFVAAFTVNLLAQEELDSLKSIMGKEESPAHPVEVQEDNGFNPIIVDDDGENVDVKVMDKSVVKVIDNGDSTTVRVGEKGIIQVIDHPDSTSIRVGDKEIRIVEKNDDTDIRFGRIEEKKERIINKKFRGHWAGLEWGVNNFLDKGNTLSREGEDWFMDLNTGRSWALNLNFFQYSLGFGTSHAGLLTGMGLEYNNYFFDNNITIVEMGDMVIADTLQGNVAKTKLTTTFLRIPLIFEFQFPNTTRSKRVFISAGIVAGLKLGSHTKVMYKGDNGKNKDKNNDDFNINPFRYGFTARVGFGNMCVFGDYYFTPLFVANKGPELHPFTVGLAMNF